MQRRSRDASANLQVEMGEDGKMEVAEEVNSKKKQDQEKRDLQKQQHAAGHSEQVQ